MITAREIQKLIFRELVKSSICIAPNVYLGKWEYDIAQVTKSKYLREFEIKLSRSDFKADAKKSRSYFNKSVLDPTFSRGFTLAIETKYEYLEAGKGACEFYYVVPENLIKVDEVPEWAGLYYVREILYPSHGFVHSRLVWHQAKKAKRLNKTLATDKQIDLIYKSAYYRFWNLFSTSSKSFKKRIPVENQLALKI